MSRLMEYFCLTQRIWMTFFNSHCANLFESEHCKRENINFRLPLKSFWRPGRQRPRRLRSLLTLCKTNTSLWPTPRDGPSCSSVLIFIDSQWGGNLPKIDTWSWAPLFPRSFSSTLYNAGSSLSQKSCAGPHSVCLTEIWLYSMSSMSEKGRRQNSESQIGIKSKVACLATPSL